MAKIIPKSVDLTKVKLTPIGVTHLILGATVFAFALEGSKWLFAKVKDFVGRAIPGATQNAVAGFEEV